MNLIFGNLSNTWEKDVHNHFKIIKQKKPIYPPIEIYEQTADTNIAMFYNNCKISIRDRMFLETLILNDTSSFGNYREYVIPSNFLKKKGGIAAVDHRLNTIYESSEDYSKLSQKEREELINSIKFKTNFSPNVLKVSEIGRSNLLSSSFHVSPQISQLSSESTENLESSSQSSSKRPVKTNIKLLKLVDHIKNEKIYADSVKFLINSFKDPSYQTPNFKILIDYLYRNLPTTKNLYNKNILKYINKISKNNVYNLFLKFINFDFTKYENEKEFSFETFYFTYYKNLSDEDIKKIYFRYIVFNNKEILQNTRLIEVLEKIYKMTDKETIIYHIYIFNFFKKILEKLFIENNIKYDKNILNSEFNDMCKLIFQLSISHGLLYKDINPWKLNSINYKLKKVYKSQKYNL